MVQLGANRYGKSQVRVVRITRAPGAADRLRDWNVSTSLSGDLDAVHLTGDNAAVLTTDTQKNTVYALTKRLGDVEPEELALALAEHFVTTSSAITRARVSVHEYAWAPIGDADHSLVRSGRQTRTTTVVHDQVMGTTVVGGVADLVVMNTTNAEFWGFPRDELTTLAETRDRVLATEVTATWRLREPVADFGGVFEAATAALLTTFAATYSLSLQQMLFTIGEQVLAAVPQLCEVRLSLPNKHHFVVDLAAFGMTNDREVYLAADRPYGLIEGTVLADDAPDAGLAWT